MQWTRFGRIFPGPGAEVPVNEIMPLPYRLLLLPLSLVYGAAARLHAWLYAQRVYTVKRLNTPVISVGNLTVGGTGKTPLMVLWLAGEISGGRKTRRNSQPRLSWLWRDQ